MNKQEIRNFVKQFNSQPKTKKPNRKKNKELRRRKIRIVVSEEEMQVYLKVLKAKQEYEDRIHKLDIDGAIRRVDMDGNFTG